TAWTSVHKKFPTTSYWNANDIARVGYESDEGNTNRSLFLLNTTPINGKRILRATFRAYETHSWSCSARPVELWLTGPISAATTWNTQPAWMRKISTISVAKKANPSCPAGGVEMDATSAVVDAARNNWTGITLGLRATSETDTNGWKKFQNNPSIGVDYNTVPGAATSVASDQGVPCVIGGSRPTIGDLTPTLYARFSSGDTGQNVRARFEWFIANGAKVGESVTPYQASNTQFSATVPAGAFASGQVLSWHVRGEDGIDNGPFSSWCEYALDSTGPTTVPSVTSTDYPENGVAGEVGYDGAFAFGPGTTTADYTKFEYTVNAGAPIIVTADAAKAATVTVTPDRSGPNILQVRAVDAANNKGPIREYRFDARDGGSPSGVWTLDDGEGQTASDSAFDPVQPLTLAGTASWAPGRDGGALSLTGATATAAASGPAVPTDRSFTVAAWVRLTSGSAFAAAASQDGTGANGNFALMYSSSANRWTFTTADSAQVITRATAPTAPQLNVWTHLTGVYDEGAKQTYLYVNGTRVATASYTSTWNAAGAFRVGGFRWAGSTQNPWDGGVDDVRVWNRAVSAPELRTLADAAALAGQWSLDEATGITTADASGNANTGTLGSGASWSNRDGVTPAVAFNGTAGGVTTVRAPIRTDQSFSVAAWARVGSTASVRTVASQSGTRNSAFALQSVGNGPWAFSVHASDTDGAASVRAQAPTPAAAGTWVHLVGTYDATTRKLSLYVNGVLVDEEFSVTTWNANGPLQIGLSKYNGAANAPMLGDVDELRVYAGILTPVQALDLSFT
ncbi:MAG: LamG domain-containing protein, partial [Pseudonocardia sp.]|nr:LamG domain-containing protein [Pseudonocardia sp.]